MKKLLLLVCFSVIGCGPGFYVVDNPQPSVVFPVASAIINVSSNGDVVKLHNKKKNSIASLLISQAFADIAQGSATVNVTYNNPGVSIFTVNTTSLGTGITITGNDLNLGTVSIGSLDDNTIRICTGVGAPSNRCNRLYIRVFTLGTATGGITNTAGFINTSMLTDVYSLNVFAGSVLTAIGFNSSPTAASVVNAATVYTYTIPGGTNRVRLSNLTNTPIPIKADLTNAGSGSYEMNLVVQYALGYI